MKIQFNKAVSDVTLYEICHKLQIPIRLICQRNELHNISQDGAYIVNLQPSTQGNGTHWCAFWKHKKTIFYFDSFSEPPPQNEVDLFFREHDTIWYSDVQIQSIKSSNCGFFCLGYFLALMHFKGPIPDRIGDYQNLFNKTDFKKNDKIIETFILHYINE